MENWEKAGIFRTTAHFVPCFCFWEDRKDSVVHLISQ